MSSGSAKSRQQGQTAEDGAPSPALMLAIPSVIDVVSASLMAATAAAVEADPSLRGQEADINGSVIATLLARHAVDCALDAGRATGLAPLAVLEIWLTDRLMRVAQQAGQLLATRKFAIRQDDTASEESPHAVH